MSLQTFNFNYQVTTSPTVVYDSLLDLKKFGKLHPYMKSVELVNDRRPEFTEYKIKEEVYFFGFIKNHPVYTAKVFEIEKQKHIQYTSQVKWFIHLTIDFKLAAHKNGSLIVQEQITLKCNKLIAIVFLDILKRSHAVVFKNLTRYSSTSSR
jgi:hypothetical protein